MIYWPSRKVRVSLVTPRYISMVLENSPFLHIYLFFTVFQLLENEFPTHHVPWSLLLQTAPIGKLLAEIPADNTSASNQALRRGIMATIVGVWGPFVPMAPRGDDGWKGVERESIATIQTKKKQVMYAEVDEAWCLVCWYMSYYVLVVDRWHVFKWPTDIERGAGPRLETYKVPRTCELPNHWGYSAWRWVVSLAELVGGPF